MRFLPIGALINLTLFLSVASTVSAEQPAPKPPVRAPVRAAPQDLVLLMAGGGFQLLSTTFTESRTERINVEQSRWDARYELENSFAFIGGASVRVWRNLMAGVSYSRTQQSRTADVSGQIPHPFFFNQPRPFEGQASPLRHQEQAVHITATWRVPLSRRVELAIVGGPSLFTVKRGFVERVTYAEEYPYDSIRFADAVSSQVSESAWGAHGGADMTWLLTPRVGISVLARYSRGAVDFTTPAGGSVSLNAGGLQTAVGLRVGLGGRATLPPRRPAR